MELTLVYDWPINTDQSRVRCGTATTKGSTIPVSRSTSSMPTRMVKRADKSFWVKGGSRAEFLIKTDRPMKRLVLTLTAGVPNEVVVTVSGHTQRLSLAAGASQQLFFALGAGFPVSGPVAGVDGVGLEQRRVRPRTRRAAEHGHSIPRRAGEAGGGGMRTRRDQGSGIGDPKAGTEMSITTVESRILLFYLPSMRDYVFGLRCLSGSLIPDPRSRPASPPCVSPS